MIFFYMIYNIKTNIKIQYTKECEHINKAKE